MEDLNNLKESTIKKIIENYEIYHSLGSLEYFWNIRNYFYNNANSIVDNNLFLKLLDDKNILEKLEPHNRNHLLSFLFFLVSNNYSIIYNYIHHGNDKSLIAILKICNNSSVFFDFDYINRDILVLSNIFNMTIKSNRKNINCYDCGTTARVIFYTLIKENRPIFFLSKNEINRIEREYLKVIYKTPLEGLNKLIRDLYRIQKPSVFLVQLSFTQFGHIFIIEKKWVQSKEIYRIFQSALNSYLIIDYVISKGYLEDEKKGINIKEFEKDMRLISSKDIWSTNEILIFIKWFCFYPQEEYIESKNIRFTSSYVVY